MKAKKWEQVDAAENVIYLARCAVKETIPDRARITSMDLDSVYTCAQKHMLGAIVAMSLEVAGFGDARSASLINTALAKSLIFDAEWKKISECFKKEGIWYMPLKGALLKEYYPKRGMREFADFDILFDVSRMADVKKIMDNFGYITPEYGVSNHDCYFKKPVLNFEMHHALFGPMHEKSLYNYYKGIQSKLLGSGVEKSFSPEDFYLYLIAHEYKHFSRGGTGIRSLLDIYVYLSSIEIDMDYVVKEAKKMNLAGFEKANRALALRLFGNEKLTQDDRVMLNYILESGVYGTKEHEIENVLRKRKLGKLRYIIKRFLVPVNKKNKRYAGYAREYPFFYKHKPLILLLPFYRIIHSMKKGRFLNEANALWKAKREKKL